jgi:hypothetical protein
MKWLLVLSAMSLSGGANAGNFYAGASLGQSRATFGSDFHHAHRQRFFPA